MVLFLAATHPLHLAGREEGDVLLVEQEPPELAGKVMRVAMEQLTDQSIQGQQAEAAVLGV